MRYDPEKRRSTRRGGRFEVVVLSLLRTLSLIAILLSAGYGAAVAQRGIPFNQRDDTYPLLGLKRAREAYEYAKAELDRTKEMFEKGLIPVQELEQVRNAFADAEVNYQQSLLAVLFENQFVSVVGAVKYQGEDGRKHVRLTLENTSGGGADFRKLVNIDDELFRTLQPDIVNDVYVSLLNDENAIVSQPYEAKIEELVFGSPAELDFALLQDMDALTVDIKYGNGSSRSPKIYLQKDASVNRAFVQSSQFSQEVELGGSASYDLTMELFSSATNVFKLEAVNLPPQITRYFVEPESQARLSQFKFTERTNTLRAALRVFMPDRPADGVSIGSPVAFYVLAVPHDMVGSVDGLATREWTLEEIEALGFGYARLELVPRGIGKLLVRAPMLYHSIRSGDSVLMNIDLLNEGTKRLDNIEFEIDVPLGWRKEVEPAVVESLGIREERRIALSFTPPEEASPGRYEIRIRSSSLSGDTTVRGEEKSVTVEIKPGTNIAGTAILVALIIGTVAGIVVFGVRLSRQ